MSSNREKMNNMAGLDIYLEALSSREDKKIEDKIYTGSVPTSLLSMDLYAVNFINKLQNARKKEDLNQLFGIDPIFKKQIDERIIMNNNYDALVLTDNHQKIQWVNKGFSKMTGYPANYALGKSPQFLQGKETEITSKQRIKEQLEKQVVFSEIVINYRKNKELYKCEITIIPLLNKQNSLTHYLAIEKEVA